MHATLRDDIKVLYHLLRPRCRQGTHQQRLESFYAGQADHYDQFRNGLLHGRSDMFKALDAPEGGLWVDLGGGTGASIEFWGDRLDRFAKGYIVDLCPSLLAKARERIAGRGCQHVEAVAADATAFTPPEGCADIVTFSYALTMIPEWHRAIDHALRLLRPGGQIGVVDFYVSRKHTQAGRKRHGAVTRTFWPWWFAFDDVFLSADHLPYLADRFDSTHVHEGRAKIPYLPGLRVPYYRFIGRKPT